MSAEPWHGTTGGYTNHACRCDDCREAKRERDREYRQRPEARVVRAIQLREWRRKRRARK